MSRHPAALGLGAAVLGVVLITQLRPVDQPQAAARDSIAAPVTAVVRTSLGELKWVATEATDYTPIEELGRQIYLQAGCTYCHSQFARPVLPETRPWGRISTDPRRWGPIGEPGEVAFDRPQSFGARGLAPDLARVGQKYGDEWHLAHFWNPPMLTKGSIMGGFSGLFDAPKAPVEIVDDGAGGRTLARTAATEALFDFASQDQVKLTPNTDGLLFVPLAAQGRFPVIWTPNDEYTGASVRLVAETETIRALTAYVQKLGMNRGRWRELFEPEAIDGTRIELLRSDAMIADGKLVYERHCVACHGVEGNGNGWAATFLHKQRPRDFTLGVFKFRLTKEPLPTDADLLRTITRGVRGTAMPAWYELPLQDRLAVIQYIKYELAADRADPDQPYFYFVEEPPGPSLEIGAPPAPAAELVATGRKIWQQAKCWECHGQSGKGDGEKAPGLKDDLGFPIVPADLTRGQFKSGPGVADIFRTISTGLSGTPMPSYLTAFAETERWALAYYILSLSAYTDPLTAAELPLPAAIRAALDDPALQTSGPEAAYGLRPARDRAACADLAPWSRSCAEASR
jgi:cytochrome c oxidase cbb3-type subunit 2